MELDALYTSYFQKSKVLLYPLLGIKRGCTAVPEQTYLSWGTKITTEDMKLVAVYAARKDQEYINFEKNVLLKHSRVTDYIKLNEDQCIFTFDFSDLKYDWQKFIKGQYSKIDSKLKRKICDHFDKNTSTSIYIDSYMFPEKYFALYADLLGTNEELLREVGELCTPPNLEKENLITEIINLQNKKILG
jgi:hypothetical protein